MERRIPWSRVIVEGFVIVASILLAFAIDAWWDGRQEIERGRELLAAVREEAAANERLVERTLDLVEAHSQRTLRFYGMSSAELSRADPDTALFVVGSMLIADTYELQRRALSEANSAEGRRLVQFRAVREALTDLQGKIDDLDERFRIMAETSQRGLLALGRHPLYQARYLSAGGSPNPTVDLRSIRDDVAVLAAASSMQRNREVYVDVLKELLVALRATSEVLAEAR